MALKALIVLQNDGIYMCFGFWLRINLWITFLIAKMAVDNSVDLTITRKK